ncbi:MULTISPECIES: hypothetical protein [unclassified Aureimonas]|uniref:hypothetical protein n=1 Tax=unclassified Aureimonas TaxID=2615206 RepID=UPI0006F52A3C|nr:MULTISPECIES: hypothetical protein [unclassified Aureimonas]KQT60376.1 hypothetical protein ASG62_06880 [Aureimonas sp. Leaf427]KQT79254.1 hypothetical protein ASG54_09480 [Aureimonas sp. Leaf460]
MSAPLTPPEHEHSAKIDEAARYVAMTPRLRQPRPIVPYLTRTFGLTPVEACAALHEATLIAGRAE